LAEGKRGAVLASAQPAMATLASAAPPSSVAKLLLDMVLFLDGAVRLPNKIYS
jgi:hypothetical protein